MHRFNLSTWALEHQQMIVFMLVIFMVSGIFAYFHLGQEEDPSFTVRSMTVQTAWPGATVYDMENQVTDKLSETLQSISEIDYTESLTRAGTSQITVTIRGDVSPGEIPDIWYDVRKKIGDMAHTLPDGVQGPFFNDEFGDTFGNIYALTGNGFSYAQLKQFAKALRREILRLPGVAKVDYVGDQDQVIYIQMSNAKLASLGIAPAKILQALAQTNGVTPSGTIETRSNQVQLRVSGEFDSLDSIRKIGIRSGDRIFKLGDIATVSRGYTDPPTFRMYFNGKPAVGIAISMLAGGNVIQLGKDLDRLMASARQRLPVGVRIHTVSDQPVVVKESVSEFTDALFEAVIIVLAVSFISLGLRTGLVVALCIPFVLALTFLAMYFLGITLQRISLGALIIALGLLVDDAIITVEMMMLKLEEGLDRKQAATFAYTSTAFPMLTGTLVTAAGFLPVALAKSSASEYTLSIFQVVSIALLLSWFTAVIFTPYLGYKLLKVAHKTDKQTTARATFGQRILAFFGLGRWLKRKQEHPPATNGEETPEEAMFNKPFYRGFRACATWCVDHSLVVVTMTVALFVLAIALFSFVPKQFFPSSDRDELVVDLWLPQAATFEETLRQAQAFGQVMAKDSDVVSYTTYVGGGSPRFYLPLDVQGPSINLAEVILLTKSMEARDRVFDRVRHLFDTGFPMVRGRVTLLGLGPPVEYPVMFRVSGPQRDTVIKLAGQVAKIMRANPNLRDVNSDQGESVQILKVDVNQDKARLLGVTTQTISKALAASLGGIATTDLREDDESISVVGRLIKPERTNIDNIGNLLVHLPDGSFTPLSTLATIKVENEPHELRERDRVPTVTIRADMQTDMQPNDATMALWPKLQEIAKTFPPGYDIAIGGPTESSQESQAAIKLTYPIVGVLVMFLLMFQLQNISKMVLVLLTAPLGMIGVTAIMLAFRIPFGFVATLGVIALLGMIIRNSVILIVQIDELCAEGYELRTAIIEAAVHRLRPIILTSACAVLAMIPLTTSTFWAPMAWAIMGGLVGATILTLLYLPALYALWYRAGRGTHGSREVTHESA